MCILFRETLQVPNLVRLRAFRGGSLQIRDTFDSHSDVPYHYLYHHLQPINIVPGLLALFGDFMSRSLSQAQARPILVLPSF
jgi:hypothetical protein